VPCRSVFPFSYGGMGWLEGNACFIGHESSPLRQPHSLHYTRRFGRAVVENVNLLVLDFVGNIVGDFCVIQDANMMSFYEEFMTLYVRTT
jgi:hypothetical protein